MKTFVTFTSLLFLLISTQLGAKESETTESPSFEDAIEYRVEKRVINGTPYVLRFSGQGAHVDILEIFKGDGSKTALLQVVSDGAISIEPIKDGLRIHSAEGDATNGPKRKTQDWKP